MPKAKSAPNKNLLTNVALQLISPAADGPDWDMACAIAFDSSPNAPLKNRPDIQEIYQKSIELIQPMVSQISGLRASPDTNAIICDRHEWIVNTASSLSFLFKDVISMFWDILEQQKAGRVARKTTGAVITTEIGLLLGFLSQKVLGQYDMGLPANRADDLLFIVEPNIMEREEKLGLQQVPLRFWILAHELTHKLQFENYGWIRDHYFYLVDKFQQIAADGIKKAKNSAWLSVSLLADKENWDLISRTQSFMSLIEGYADFVMFSVGENLAGYEELKPVFSRKRVQQPIFKKLFEKLIGIDMKLSQYRQGLAFVAQINKLAGLAYLNEQMDSPEKIPTIAELAEPKKWLRRVDK